MRLSLKIGSRRRPRHRSRAARTLADLGRGETGILERIDLPEEVARRLMELGFLPGSPVTAAERAPGGDPCVFRVDGSEVALRREMAKQLSLRRPSRVSP